MQYYVYVYLCFNNQTKYPCHAYLAYLSKFSIDKPQEQLLALQKNPRKQMPLYYNFVQTTNKRKKTKAKTYEMDVKLN